MVPDRAGAAVFTEGVKGRGKEWYVVCTEEKMRMFPEVERKEVSHTRYMIQVLKNEQEFS